MKKFSLLLLSAIMGGVVTLGGFKLFYEKNNPIKIEHVTQTPVYGTSYSVNKDGELTPLHFTDVSKKVMDAVVHIKSTQIRGSQKSATTPFQDFFKDDFFRHSSIS